VAKDRERDIQKGMVGRIANESSGSIESRLPDMATLQEIENEVKQLTRAEQEALRDWLENLLEDELEFTDEFKAKIERGEHLAKGEIYLLAIGHRREIYRDKT